MNFAVPASAVIKLLSGQVQQATKASTPWETAQSLLEKRSALEYSAEAGSPYQKNQAEMRSAFLAAIERAVKNDVPALLRVCEQLSYSIDYADMDIVESAAERASRLISSSATNLALAKALQHRAIFSNPPDQILLLERSEKAGRQAISLTKQPTAEMYHMLGSTLVMRDNHKDADTTLRRALELSRASGDVRQQAMILRDLISAAQGLKWQSEVDKWFSNLLQTNDVTVADWIFHASRLDASARFGEAGKAWQKAAEINGYWSHWCEAASSFGSVAGEEDSVLFTGRKCIALGAGKPKSEGYLSTAHTDLAIALNNRGVFEEALSHAKEATTLNTEYASAYDQQAVALLGLHRPQEAINAAKQAVRVIRRQIRHNALPPCCRLFRHGELAFRSSEL